MKRTCNECRKNKGRPEFNSCGYLSPEQRKNGKKMTVKGFDFVADVCPVHTYLENIEIYECINLYKNASPADLNYKERLIIDTYRTYIAANKEEK